MLATFSAMPPVRHAWGDCGAYRSFPLVTRTAISPEGEVTSALASAEANSPDAVAANLTSDNFKKLRLVDWFVTRILLPRTGFAVSIVRSLAGAMEVC